MATIKRFEDLKIPSKSGYYWARIEGEWEPVSVFDYPKHKSGTKGVILIGSDEILKADDERIEEFGDFLVKPKY